MARFLALSATVFKDAHLWGKREYSPMDAAVDIAGLASFAARDFDEKGVRLRLELRETRPLSVRFLMERWGWKSTATVARFLHYLETRSGTLAKHRTTRLGNTYLVGERLLARCGETPNETPSETGNETPNETKYKKGLKNTPPTGETPARVRGSKRLPKDWSPTEADISFAVERGIDPDEQLDAMRDCEFSKAHIDWSATWRTWSRREAKENGRRNGNGRHPPEESDKAIISLAERVQSARNQ